MTTQIIFRCVQCKQTETLSLEEFRLTGYPQCPHHHMRMEADTTTSLPNDEISQAVNDAMRAMTRLTVVALRGGKGSGPNSFVCSERE